MSALNPSVSGGLMRLAWLHICSLLATTKDIRILNVREKKKEHNNIWQVSHSINDNLQQGCQHMVPLQRKIWRPGGMCSQVSSGLWRTQLSVMWTVGLLMFMSADWHHGCYTVCFRTVSSVFVERGYYIGQGNTRVLTSPLPYTG